MLLDNSRSPTDDELLRYTGQNAVRDVQTAVRLVAQASEAARAASVAVRRHSLSLPACFLRYCTTVVTTESDHADAVILGAVLAFPATILSIVLFRPQLPTALGFFFAVVSLLYAVYHRALKTRPEEQSKDRSALRRERWWSFFRERKQLTARRDACLGDLYRKRRLLSQLGRAVRKVEEIAALLTTDLRAMSGLQFEQFLERVFIVHGYPEVLRTKASGDQGIDLVISTGKERIAIQAKLYQGSVGNEAVQQAFTGMVHYRCDRCAVVTNSVFTRAAVELAASTGCKLIDGERLQGIITGKELV
jgi:hypothetical protein